VFYNSLVPEGELAHAIRVFPQLVNQFSIFFSGFLQRRQFIHTLAEEGEKSPGRGAKSLVNGRAASLQLPAKRLCVNLLV
jgi:hypothetical protein